MNLHVIVEKMLPTSSPNFPRPSLLRRLTTPSSMTEAKITLAAALAQAPSSSSLAASADRGEKALKALCLITRGDLPPPPPESESVSLSVVSDSFRPHGSHSLLCP